MIQKVLLAGVFIACATVPIANGLKCHQTILVSESAEPADADSCETANGFCYKIRQEWEGDLLQSWYGCSDQAQSGLTLTQLITSLNTIDGISIEEPDSNKCTKDKAKAKIVVDGEETSEEGSFKVKVCNCDEEDLCNAAHRSVAGLSALVLAVFVSRFF